MCLLWLLLMVVVGLLSRVMCFVCVVILLVCVWCGLRVVVVISRLSV